MAKTLNQKLNELYSEERMLNRRIDEDKFEISNFQLRIQSRRERLVDVRATISFYENAKIKFSAKGD